MIIARTLMGKARMNAYKGRIGETERVQERKRARVVGLAKVGRIRMAKVGLAKLGFNRHKSPRNLFNTRNLSRLGGYCLRKHLDAIFDPGRVLQEVRQLQVNFVEFVPPLLWRGNLSHQVQEETIRGTQFGRGGWHRRYRLIRSITRT